MFMTLAEWRASPKSDLVRAASTLETIDGLNTMTVGTSPTTWRVPDTKICAPSQSVKRSELLYVNINPETDRARTAFEKSSGKTAWNALYPRKCTRKSCLEALFENEFTFNDFGTTTARYLERMRTAEFAASLEGNSVDCHRTYEALVCGAVPIVERAHEYHLRNVYGAVPLVFTDDYTEITLGYLHEQLAQIHTQTYDWSRLHFRNLTPQEQATITHRTPVWARATRNGWGEPPLKWQRQRKAYTREVERKMLGKNIN